MFREGLAETLQEVVEAYEAAFAAAKETVALTDRAVWANICIYCTSKIVQQNDKRICSNCSVEYIYTGTNYNQTFHGFSIFRNWTPKRNANV